MQSTAVLTIDWGAASRNTAEGIIALVVGVAVVLLNRPLVRVFLFSFGRVLRSRPFPMTERGAERFIGITLLLVATLLIVTGVGLLLQGD